MKEVEKFMMPKKICSKCKRELEITNFRWKNKAKGLFHSQCKDCQKAQEKLHYQESLERQTNVRATADSQKIINMRVVDEARQAGCKKCGEKRPYVLDFHHCDGDEKIATINRMIKSSSVETLRKELEKCDVLCANCHREFHYLNFHNQIKYEEYLQLGDIDRYVDN